MSVRYWLYLAAKIAVASVALFGLLILMDRCLPTDANLAAAAKTAKSHAARPAPPTPDAQRTDPAAQRDMIWLVPGAVTTPEEDATLLAPLSNGSQHLECSLAVMGWFLLAVGIGYVIVWDQRYRCRTCLRRLRMPVETGSWGQMLQFGRPRIEYICVYGHGTLRAEELQISGREQPEWTPNSDDFWQELCASGKDSSTRG